MSLLIAGEAHLPGGGAVRVHRSFSEPPCVPRLTDVSEHPLHTDRPPFPRTPPCTDCVTDFFCTSQLNPRVSPGRDSPFRAKSGQANLVLPYPAMAITSSVVAGLYGPDVPRPCHRMRRFHCPQHRRTVGPCVSLANHSCDYADCRGHLRQTL